MNTHRLVIEHLWPSPSMTVLAAGPKDFCLAYWDANKTVTGLKEGDEVVLMEVDFVVSTFAVEYMSWPGDGS